MEIISFKLIILLLLLFCHLTTNASVSAAGLISQELDAAIFALQSSGYKLFAKAITTSGLHLCLLLSENNFFTLFAPPYNLLFSLYLFSSGCFYTSLLHHVCPWFLSVSDISSLPSPAYLETLQSNRNLFVEYNYTCNTTISLIFTLDGVRILVPDLFIGSNIAIHGLNGIF